MNVNTVCLKCGGALNVRTSENPTLQTCISYFRCNRCDSKGKAVTEIVEFNEPVAYQEVQNWRMATKPLNQLDTKTVDMFAAEYTQPTDFKY